MNSSSLVTANKVTYKVAATPILQEVSLSLEPGKITTLIGPNGAGKTTLLKILIGIEKPSSGSITWAPDLKIGYMPQKVTLDASLPMTVRRFLTLFHLDIKKEALEVVTHNVGITALLERSIHVLSGGEYQRVLLARALLGKPSLLILDEPTQGIDVMGQADLYRLISEQRDRSGCGVLIVSHDLHHVMASCDEVICLNTHVCCHGSPVQVQEDPDYLKLFGKRHQEQPVDKGLATYVHHHDHDHSHDHTT